MIYLSGIHELERMIIVENTMIDAKRIEAVSERVRQAAIETLGDRLDKVYLYDVNGGAYDGADLSFLIVAHVTQEEASKEDRKIRQRLEGVCLEHNVLYLCHVTGCEIFNKYANVIDDYKSAVEEGTLLYG